jgi:hypothetical protein
VQPARGDIRAAGKLGGKMGDHVFSLSPAGKF